MYAHTIYHVLVQTATPLVVPYRLIETILIYMLLFCVVSLVCVVSCHLIYLHICMHTS